MKKKILIFAVLCLYPWKVQACSFSTTEKIIPIVNFERQLVSLDDVFVIEKENSKKIDLESSVFQVLKDYQLTRKKINIHLQIINHTDSSYQYVNNSFHFAISAFKQRKNQSDYYLYRTQNKALRNLCGGLCLEKEVTDDALSDLLQKKGYRGVEDLLEYYLDFYNSLYHLHKKNILEFSDIVMDDILLSPPLKVLETNQDLAVLFYDYFYDAVLKYQVTNKFHPISYYQRQSDDTFFFRRFHLIARESSKKIDDMVVFFDSKYQNVYPAVYFDFSFLFSLQSL